MDALLYLLRSGQPWRMLRVTTIQRYFYLWRDGGLWKKINHVLLMEARQAEGRLASPSAGVIDSHPSASSG